MSKNKETTIVIVDDEELFRGGLAGWLSTLNRISVVGEAGTAEEALQIVSQLNPKVLLIDLLLPGSSGVRLVHEVHDLNPEIKSILLSDTIPSDLIIDGFKAGAVGFLPKTISPEEMQLALTSVVEEDNWYISPSAVSPLMQKVFYLVKTNKKELEESSCPQVELSEREREVLKMLAEGHNYKSISEALGCSIRTIERIKVALENKTGASTLTDIIRTAIRLELVSV